MQKSIFQSVITVAMFSIATLVFAESAPVYDADSVQEQFDTASNDPGPRQPDVMPPAPGQEANAFIPVSPSVGVPTLPTASSSTRAVVVAPPTGNMSVEKRLKRLEQQLATSQGSENVARIETLQGEVQSLRGQIEQLNHQLAQMQDQQKSVISDFDKRLTDALKNGGKKTLAAGISVDNGGDAVAPASTSPATATTTKTGKAAKTTKVASSSSVAAEAAAAVQAPAGEDSPKASAQSTADQPNVAEEQQIYQTAYNLIKAKKYNEAVTSLQGMLKKYPSGQFASNAHYWLGELFGLLNKNDDALTEFTVVVSKYPESPRVADAQLKVGLIYAAESNWSEAKTAFKKVVNHYPGTASARVAAEQLKAIKQTGN